MLLGNICSFAEKGFCLFSSTGKALLHFKGKLLSNAGHLAGAPELLKEVFKGDNITLPFHLLDALLSKSVGY